MATVVLPTPLTRQTDGRDRLGVPGSTAGEVLAALERSQPNLRGWVLDERGRLRQHVNLFVNGESADLDRAVGDDDELYVLQAISGGGPEGDEGGGEVEILAGTKKGLVVVRGHGAGRFEVGGRLFPGEAVEYACRDPRSGRTFAAITHGQFGPRIFWTDHPAGDWEQADGPAFPADADAAVARIWIVRPGAADGELWAGVAPAALFHSADDGRSWQLVRGLWDQPGRPDWEGGLGGLALHSICPWPGEPRRLAVGISAVGVWITEDGGESWRRHADGLVPRYLPEEARADTIMHCVHKMERAPAEPETLYMQFHGGVYRSDDGGRRWHDIAGVGRRGGLPADFGFPLVVDPRDPDRAWVIPLNADQDRVTAEGRVRVYRTSDRGASWEPLTRGLPQHHAYHTVLRQAFAHDGGDPTGLYFGTEQGTIFASGDGGDSWSVAARELPPVYSVQASR